MSGIRFQFAIAALLLLCASAVLAQDSAVVLIYHHVADNTPAATSVRPDEFDAQLALIEREGYRVLPLMSLIEALASGEPVPEKSVAISFDDAYVSVLTEALPRLAARDWPFTIFVSTAAIDDGYRGYLSWDQLRQLGAAGATIGNHSVSHEHLVRRAAGEDEAAWRTRIAMEIRTAGERLEQELGDYLIPAFAYPYGEYTAELKAIVADFDLYGFAQHSGAVGRGSDFLALPRYPIATGMDIENDFRLRVRSLALPLTPLGPERHIVGDDDPRPLLQFRLDGQADDVRSAELACYASGQGRMTLELVDSEQGEYQVRPTAPLAVGRSKLNCTAPSRSRAGDYYWYGYLWMRPHEDGRWYDE